MMDNRSDDGRRRAAEARLERVPKARGPDSNDADLRRLAHELQVHQLELEMQNEELRRSRAELEEARNGYRTLYDFAPVGYLTVDRIGTILAANLTVAELLGVERNGLVDRRLLDFIDASDRDAFVLFLDNARTSGIRLDIDVKLLDHRLIYAHLRSDRLEPGEPNRDQVRIAVLDVTERRRAETRRYRQAEEALQDARRFNENILASSGEGLAAYDRSLRIVAWNAFLEDLTGRLAKDVLGKHLNAAIPSLAQLVLPCAQQSLIGRTVRVSDMAPVIRGTTQFPKAAEVDGFPDDGRLVWFLATYAPLRDAHGDIDGVVMSLRDVTTLKRTQDALGKSTSRLRRLTAYVERAREDERKRIARELHDELGSNLTGLTMQLRTAYQEAAKLAPTVAAQLAGALELLDVARESTRRIMNDLRPHMLDNLGVWAAIEALGAQVHSRTGIAFELTVDEGLEDRWVEAELATALFRVTQEALTNVARHAGATRVKVSAHTSGSMLTLDVFDNGKGIGADRLLNAESYGLLGMEERVQQFGGTFRVETKPGLGTRVVVTVPFEPARTPAAS